MAEIFDSHSHYYSNRFDSDRNEVLSGLKDKGVGLVLVAGCDIESSKKVSQLCRDYDFVFGSAGVHPTDSIRVTGDYLSELKKLFSENPKLVAVGEIGYDYFYDTPKEIQTKFFREQLTLAKELDKPVIIHSREASRDTLELLKEFKPKGVVHCYSSSTEIAKEIVNLGMYIGFTGVITFDNAKKAKVTAREIPLERILIETDCPYLAPVPFRGQRCDSSMLTYVADAIAEIRGISREEVIKASYDNAIRAYEMEGLI